MGGNERDWPAAQHKEKAKLFTAHQTFNMLAYLKIF